jgi:hypothetical protein
MEDVLILWDCENVRVPSELAPRVVLRHLLHIFVTGPKRRCVGCYAAFSALSSARLHAFDDYVNNNAGLNARMLYAPGGQRKSASTDHPLVDEMLTFAETCCLAERPGVIVLITGDADFVRPAVWCTHHGTVRLESVYHGPSASQDVLRLDAHVRVEWGALLDAAAPRPAGGWTFEHSVEFREAKADRQAAHQGRQAASALNRRARAIRASADDDIARPVRARADRARAATSVQAEGLEAAALQARRAGAADAADAPGRGACPDLIDLEAPPAPLIELSEPSCGPDSAVAVDPFPVAPRGRSGALLTPVTIALPIVALTAALALALTMMGRG